MAIGLSVFALAEIGVEVGSTAAGIVVIAGGAFFLIAAFLGAAFFTEAFAARAFFFGAAFFATVFFFAANFFLGAALAFFFAALMIAFLAAFFLAPFFTDPFFTELFFFAAFFTATFFAPFFFGAFFADFFLAIGRSSCVRWFGWSVDPGAMPVYFPANRAAKFWRPDTLEKQKTRQFPSGKRFSEAPWTPPRHLADDRPFRDDGARHA